MKIELKDRKYTTKMEDIPKIVKEIAKDTNVKAVYLFGSCATGKTHTLSDIDLCIISNGKETADYPRTDNLDVVYFHRLPLIIQFRVLNDGKALIIKDKEFVYKLRGYISREYIDFLPAIQRFVKNTLQCTTQ